MKINILSYPQGRMFFMGIMQYPLPGEPTGKFSGRRIKGSLSIKSIKAYLRKEWLPPVRTSAPLSKRRSASYRSVPLPSWEFSAFTITRSACSRFLIFRRCFRTNSHPGAPNTSPTASIFIILQPVSNP